LDGSGIIFKRQIIPRMKKIFLKILAHLIQYSKNTDRPKEISLILSCHLKTFLNNVSTKLMYSPNLQKSLTFFLTKDGKINQLEIFFNLMISFEGLNFTLLPPPPGRQRGDLYIGSWKCSESFNLIGHPIRVKLILNYFMSFMSSVFWFKSDPRQKFCESLGRINVHSWTVTTKCDFYV